MKSCFYFIELNSEIHAKEQDIVIKHKNGKEIPETLSNSDEILFIKI
jgi:hypothetical protein